MSQVQNNDGEDKHQGFVKHDLAKSLPHPFHSRDGWGGSSQNEEPPLTLAEMRMITLSWAIRQKDNWFEKYKDPIIRAKWREEALAQQEDKLMEEKLTENMIDFVLEELKVYENLIHKESGIQLACDDLVFWSKHMIPDDLTMELKRAVAKLEDIPEDEKDWHPGSNGQVLDLVHPSLYPIIYGRTLVRPKNRKAKPPFDRRLGWAISDDFCWLPSDFKIGKDGEATLASPYINNILPSNSALISVVERLVAAFVPMWERVLGGLDKETLCGTRFYPRIDNAQDGLCLWHNAAEQYPPDSQCLAFPGNTWRERHANWARTKTDLTLPEVNAKNSLNRSHAVTSLEDRTLQIIVKLANIHLTPENPEYHGGSWHVEGMLNERIVSTGIYYYDSENITDSHLAFRTCISAPEYHEQDDDICIRWWYGIERDDHLVQSRGGCPTEGGTCLAFPNIYQHCVSPFSLVDPTKPGHRKIVALFLVDPTEPIVSATKILPQQREWFREAIHASPTSPCHDRFTALPSEIKDIIIDKINNLISLEEAKDERAELMKERSAFVTTFDDQVVNIGYNMCEH
ncbi:hypothetical protein DL96DRAFT_1777437 [Flagelloscypha sp. PMI_526]|nr:hypothetical protein DL96DRAFT_1777437 [Flagelloscypha sp. PMI_526]